MRPLLITPLYWGPLDYFAHLLKAEHLLIDDLAPFKKQSYRNRSYIAGPNGKLMINLALDQNKKDELRQVKINTREAWQQKHWQAFQSSYGGSPFFDSVAPDIKECLEIKSPYLLALNHKTLQTSLAWLNHRAKISLLSEFTGAEKELQDLRETFHPKVSSKLSFPSYPQVFDYKYPFSPNLSIIDLICNEGPAAYDYLRAL